MASLARPEMFGFIVENIGGGEIVVIAFLALVVLGPDRIPEMARGAGRLINRAKAMTSDLKGDMADVINDPAMQPIRELGEFATRPRQKLAEYALEAEAEARQKTTDEEALDPPASEGDSQDTNPEQATVPAPPDEASPADSVADDVADVDSPTS